MDEHNNTYYPINVQLKCKACGCMFVSDAETAHEDHIVCINCVDLVESMLSQGDQL